MARLPNPGEDAGSWGNVLNDFLLQTHTTDGTLRDNSVTAAALAPGVVRASSFLNTSDATNGQMLTLDSTAPGGYRWTTASIAPQDTTPAAVFDARSGGMVGDGTTDDAPAFQALIDQVAAQGGGVIHLPKGRYRLVRGVKWKSRVSLEGEGVGVSVLLPDDQGTLTGVSAIGYDAAAVSYANPMINCQFRNFEIDGSLQTYPTYHVQNKGIFIQYCRNMVFRDIYIHDTVATGFGADYLDNVVIDSVKVYNCGKRWTPGQNGGSGIGIGTGGLENEMFCVVNCQTINCGQYGIFVEDQMIFNNMAQHFTPRGIVISNNIIKNGRGCGIAVIGGTNTSIFGNIVYGNASHGLKLANASSADVSIIGNHFYDNVGCGIVGAANASYRSYTIRTNKLRNNTGAHIQFSGMVIDSLSISENDIRGGSSNGIAITAVSTSLDRLSITGNTINQTAGHGIRLATKASNIDITGNMITAGSASAIYLEGEHARIGIVANKLWGNARYGIEQVAASSTTDMLLAVNETRNNTLGGTQLAGVNTNTIESRGNNTGDQVLSISGSQLSISGANGNTVTIPTSGSVAAASPHYFTAHNSTSANATANAWTKATLFDTKLLDSDNAYSTSSARFTCTTAALAGVWQISAVLSQNVSANSKLVVAVYKNGTLYRLLGRGSSAITDVSGVSGSALVPLALNDYVEIYYYTTSGATFASAANYSSFEGYKIA